MRDSAETHSRYTCKTISNVPCATYSTNAP